MAVGYSDEYVAKCYATLRGRLMRTLIQGSPLVEWLRRGQRLLPPPPLPHTVPPCRINDALEKAAPHFRTHGWAFVENILDQQFHRALKEHWPQRRYFTAPFDRYKSYDKGFGWVVRNPAEDIWSPRRARDLACGDSEYPGYAELHPHIRALFDFFASTDFAARLTRFTGRDGPLVFNRFQLTRTYTGTLVAPHRDSNQHTKNWVSMIFHIAGTGGPQSGGLAILGDNRFEHVIFEAQNLTNTCVLYNPAAPFFHGVRPVAVGKFRWMVAAEFVCPDDEAGSSG
ncbi:MAG: hypothetical protein ACREV1_02835 [Gammaproteobacteria bacterium]